MCILCGWMIWKTCMRASTLQLKKHSTEWYVNINIISWSTIKWWYDGMRCYDNRVIIFFSIFFFIYSFMHLCIIFSTYRAHSSDRWCGSCRNWGWLWWDQFVSQFFFRNAKEKVTSIRIIIQVLSLESYCLRKIVAYMIFILRFSWNNTRRIFVPFQVSWFVNAQLIFK